MKQYPDVYYTLNEMSELSGYDRKAFMDRLKRVGEMYDIPISEFKAYPDEKDSIYIFVPEVAEFLLVLVKNIDKHPLYGRNAKIQNFTATNVADFLHGLLKDIDENISEEAKEIVYCRNAHHVAQRTADWAERLSKHLTRFIVNVSTLKTEDVGEALRLFTRQVDQMNHALYMNNKVIKEIQDVNEEELFDEDSYSPEEKKIFHNLNDSNIGLDIVISTLIKAQLATCENIRKNRYLDTQGRFEEIQALSKCIGLRDLEIEEGLEHLSMIKTKEDERKVYRQYFMRSEEAEERYSHAKEVADYCKKYDDAWKSIDEQEKKPDKAESLSQEELARKYAEIRKQLVEVENRQAELHSQMYEIEMALHNEEYEQYCKQIDNKYRGLEDVTSHFIGQALNEFLKRD